MEREEDGKCTIKQVHEAFDKTLYLDNYYLIDIPLAMYVVKHLPGDPLWIRINAPSGIGKSTVIKSILKNSVIKTTPEDLLEKGYNNNLNRFNILQMSQFTSASVASGLDEKDREEELGAMLQNRDSMVIINDLSSIATMNSESLTKLQGTLRELYDGFVQINTFKVSKRYENIHTSLLMYATPQTSRFLDEGQMLGSREFSFTIQRSYNQSNQKKLLTFIEQNTIKETENEKIRDDIILQFLQDYDNVEVKQISKPFLTVLKKFAIDVAQFRAVPEVNNDGQVSNIIITEVPSRIYKQLIKLARGLITMGYNEKEAQDIILYLVEHSGNMLRHKILSMVLKEDKMTASKISYVLGVSTKDIKRELWVLYQLKKVKPSFDPADKSTIWEKYIPNFKMEI